LQSDKAVKPKHNVLVQHHATGAFQSSKDGKQLARGKACRSGGQQADSGRSHGAAHGQVVRCQWRPKDRQVVRCRASHGIEQTINGRGRSPRDALPQHSARSRNGG